LGRRGRREALLRLNQTTCRNSVGVTADGEGGILPPRKNARFFGDPQTAERLELIPPGRMPGSMAGETPPLRR